MVYSKRRRSVQDGEMYSPPIIGGGGGGGGGGASGGGGSAIVVGPPGGNPQIPTTVSEAMAVAALSLPSPSRPHLAGINQPHLGAVTTPASAPPTPASDGTYFPPIGITQAQVSSIGGLPPPAPAYHHHHHHHAPPPPPPLPHRPAYSPHQVHPPQLYPAPPFLHEVQAHHLPPPPTLPIDPRSSHASGIPHFKRSYQACMPCRSRKVKCDLGNPDAPNAPPCARCRREGKECVFSGPRASTKRKQDSVDESVKMTQVTTNNRSRSQSTSDAEGGLVSSSTAGEEEREIKRKRGSNAYPLRRWDEETSTYRRIDQIGKGAPNGPNEVQASQVSPWSGKDPLFVRRGKGKRDVATDGSKNYGYTPLPAGRGHRSSAYCGTRNENIDSGDDNDNNDTNDEGVEAQETGEEDILVTTEMHSTHDAMNLLFQAAERMGRLSPIPNSSSEQGGDADGASASESESQAETGNTPTTTKTLLENGEADTRDTQVPDKSDRNTLSPEETPRSRNLDSNSSSPHINRRKLTSDTVGHPHRRRTSHQTQRDATDNPAGSFGPSSSKYPSGPIPAPLDLPPASATPWLFVVQPFISPNPAQESISRALAVWEKFKFCKLRWITPFEAFTFINYFHTHLLPLSPILSGHFALPSAQHDLLTNEPVLAITMLTIASRYCPLEANSRSIYLHKRLWQFTQGLVGRVTWGQDRGTGKRRGKETKGLRGLGTVEALLLWTEWHPRGIHFPPGEVGEEEGLMGGLGTGLDLGGEGAKRGTAWDVSLISDTPEGSSDDDSEVDSGTEEKEAKNVDRWLEEVVEPTRRSDRLSWMLLGTALILAHELGIFDTSSADDLAPDPSNTSQDTETPRRIFRLRKLCYIYLHSLSTRLNWSSPLDNNRKLLTTITNHTETAYTPGRVILTKYEQKWHKIMALYLDLTVLVRNATEMLFPSKRFTKEIVRTGKYVGLVEHFGQVLSAWERGSEELNKHKGDHGANMAKELEEEGILIPKPFWNVLRIEYCYARIFVYCIALEAVGERRKRQQAQEKERGRERASEENSSQNAGPGMLGGSFLGGAFGTEEIDWDFIQMAFTSGLEILSIVTAGGEVSDANPPDNKPISSSAIPWLRFAPVRVYVRIIFAAIFLLKATALLLSLGPGIVPHTTRVMIITQSKKCLHLLSLTVQALRRCAVDDVHLANTFAELLGMHIDVLKWRVYPREGGRGGHGVHARGGRAAGGVGRGAIAVGTGAIRATNGLVLAGNNIAAGTSRVDAENEVQVVFPPTPAGVRDDEPATASTRRSSGTINQENTCVGSDQGTSSGYHNSNIPTSSATLSHSIAPNITSNLPNIPSQPPTSSPPVISSSPPAYSSHAFPVNQMWGFSGNSPLDFSTLPTSTSMFGGSLTSTSSMLHPHGGASINHTESQGGDLGDWDFPEIGFDDSTMANMFTAAGGNGSGGGGGGGAGGNNGLPGGGGSAPGAGGDGHGGNGHEGLLRVAGNGDGLGTYGMPGGGMGGEEGVMDFLWDYSMGGGGGLS